MKTNTQAAKVILIGDTGVGKTSIVTSLVNNDFNEQTRNTIGADFHCQKIELKGCGIGGEDVTVQL